MQKLYLVAILMLGATCAIAQKKSVKGTEIKNAEEAPASTESVVETNKKTFNDDGPYRAMFSNALKYNDVSTAIVACHYLIAADPQNKALKDTLVMLYFESQSYLQCLMMTGELLQTNPDDQRMLEIQAISQQRLGLIKESLDSYEKLYKKSQSILHAYQIANLQFILKRFGECEATIGLILKDPKSEQEKVKVIINNQASQDVIVKAAALNIAGVIYMEQNQDDKAKKFFEEALKVDQDFVLPKGNLELLANKNQPKQKQNTNPKPNPAPKTGSK